MKPTVKQTISVIQKVNELREYWSNKPRLMGLSIKDFFEVALILEPCKRGDLAGEYLALQAASNLQLRKGNHFYLPNGRPVTIKSSTPMNGKTEKTNFVQIRVDQDRDYCFVVAVTPPIGEKGLKSLPYRAFYLTRREMLIECETLAKPAHREPNGVPLMEWAMSGHELCLRFPVRGRDFMRWEDQYLVDLKKPQTWV